MAQRYFYYSQRLTNKILAIIGLVITYLLFTSYYFGSYKRNEHNFIFPPSYNHYKFQSDSLNLSLDINSIKYRINEEEKKYEHISNLYDCLSQLTTKLDEKQNLHVHQKIYVDNFKYIQIISLNENIKNGEKLFNIFHITGPLIETVSLNVKPIPMGKFYRSPISLVGTYKEKIEQFKETLKRDIISLQDIISKNKLALIEYRNGLDELKSTGGIGMFDFMIFSGNIHISLSFNGVIPGSTKIQLVCVFHKALVAFFYYIYFFKKKEIFQDS